jgi:hypothetical protein
MDEWNLNDWQGRTKKQVDFSNKVASISLIIVSIMLIILGLINLFK